MTRRRHARRTSGSKLLRRASRRSRKSLLLVFALLFGAAATRPARAMCVEFTTPPAISVTSSGTFSVSAADIDGDGDLDSLSASFYDDKIAWYENLGAGDGSSWAIHTISETADAATSVLAVDVDRDGDVDVVSASFSGEEIAWHENLDLTTPGTGNGLTWTVHTISLASSGARSVFAADVDGDGDPDVLSASQTDSTIAWHENLAPGDGSSWASHEIFTEATGARSVFAADVDGDGDLDALSASYADNRIAWYESDGTPADGGWTPHDISLEASGANSVFAADVDGDGDVDVLSASTGDDRIAWYENVDLTTPGTGDGSSWSLSTISTAGDGARSVFAADLDGDGDLDALSGSIFDNEVAWHENLGDGVTWSRHTLATDAFSPFAVFAADLDGDGDTDALAGFSFPLDGKIAWYRNEQLRDQALFAPSATISDGVDGGFSVFAADVDGDGDTDALSASVYDDQIAWHENDGTGGGWTLHSISLDANGALSVFAADVDGDGDTDALSASLYDNKVAWYENLDLTTPGSGNGSNWTEHAISVTAAWARSVFAADVDGDGDTDALSASFNDDKIAWYENLDLTTPGTGDGSIWTEHAISVTATFAVWVFAADVDGDGDTDALSASTTESKIAWYENLAPGDGSTWTVHTISLGADGASSVAAADMDGDGDLDALSASRSDDKVAWYENDGTPVDGGWIERVITTAADYAISAIAADADGDGDFDVLSVSRNDDKLAWYENDGVGGGWTVHTIATAAGAAESVFAADVDGDGDTDALTALRSADAIAWYPNLGAGVFDDGFDSDANLACWSSGAP